MSALGAAIAASVLAAAPAAAPAPAPCATSASAPCAISAPATSATRTATPGPAPSATRAAIPAAASSTDPASADTIYLVNGRVIHTDSTRIEDGRVHFTQFGGDVSIPLEEVVRIVDNDKAERVSGTLPAGKNDAADKVAGLREETSAREAGNSGASVGTGASSIVADADSPDQPEYWIERILEVDERITRVQAELDRLPYYDETDERLLRFSGQARYFIAERKRWETMLEQLKLTRQRLYYGARKAGITPGSLRRGLRK